MCGIAGTWGSNPTFSPSLDTLRAMCDQIIHRGPDEEGLLVEGNVSLGMRRLSIIDLTGGSQPIYNEDRSVVTVFNGEIYNFLELRKELEDKGHTFYSNCDTEVIVHLYEELGREFVSRLRGMFAIALYDRRADELFLARDRVGKKPLHYALDRGVLYFGSEIKSILAVAPHLAETDPSSLMKFFYYGYIPDPATVFKKISKLPPGHWLQFHRGDIKPGQYWDLPQFASQDFSEEEGLDQLETVLEDAVRMRLISDVPLGALLSGGVDSSLVVAMMAKVSDSRVKTFSIAFQQAEFNEASYARTVAKTFGTEHHELLVEPDLWNTLEHLTSILDEPFADSSIVPTYHISRLARQHVKVVLSGDGGDEMFIGYDRYLAHYRRRFLNLIPQRAAEIYRSKLYPLLPRKVRGRKLSYSCSLPFAERYADGVSLMSSHDRDLSLLSPEFVNTLGGESQFPQSVVRSYFETAPASDVLSRMQYSDVKTYLTADVLAKVDRMSMAASLEVRSPLIDHLFIELAAGLPLRLKMRHGVRKYLLRKLAERLGVPKEVLYRPKQGFALPLVHWMRDEMRQELAALLTEPRTLQRGYFRRMPIERILNEHNARQRDHSAIIWQLLVFELWHRNYLERRSDRVCRESTVSSVQKQYSTIQ